MIDLGLMTYFLRMEIKQVEDEVFICQRKYAKKKRKKFHMEDCKATVTPMNQKESLNKEDVTDKIEKCNFRSLIGCLMYFTTSRPNILFIVSLLSCFMHCASELHLKAAKRVLKYIKGIVNFGVKFKKNQCFKLQGFSNSDWRGSVDDTKKTSRYCFSLGSGIFCGALRSMR